MALMCTACLKLLDNLDPVGNQPVKGVEFITYGHYGSTVFDPMNGTQIAINICDACLRRAIDAGAVLEIHRPDRPKVTYTVFSDDTSP
jgi:hypothetical protein